jgi:hypothetical protein
MLPPRWAHAAMPTADGQLIICGGANGPISYGEIVSLAVDLLVAKVQCSVFVVRVCWFQYFLQAFMEKMTSGSVENVGQPLDRVVSLRDSPTTTPHSSTEDSLLLQLPPHQQVCTVVVLLCSSFLISSFATASACERSERCGGMAALCRRGGADSTLCGREHFHAHGAAAD